MNLFVKALLVASCGALSACGSGSGSFAVPTEYDDLLEDYDNFKSNNPLLEITDSANVPTSGSAGYTGVIKLDVDIASVDYDEYAGTITFAVDFDATASFTGAVTDVYDSDGDAVSGSLAITGGTLDPTADPVTEFQLDGDIDGTLTELDSTEILFDGTVLADFFGDGGNDAEFIAGEYAAPPGAGGTSGTADIVGGASGTFTADLIAEMD